jgi:hypothetical protein
MERRPLQPNEESNHAWRLGLVPGHGWFPCTVQEDSQNHEQEGVLRLTQAHRDLLRGNPAS